MTTAVRRDYCLEQGLLGVVRSLPRPWPQGIDVPLNSVTAAGSVGAFVREMADYVMSGAEHEPPTIPVESGNAPVWLDDVYSKVAAGVPDDAIDILFDHIDDLLIEGRFSECEDVLMMIDPKRLDTNLLVAALSITKAAADRLPSRVRFVQRVEHRLTELAPERLEALLGGLR